MKLMQRDVDYVFIQSMAITLEPEQVCENHSCQTGEHSRTHADGWTIRGDIFEDYCYWVNDFEAEHPIYGKVCGNFEEKVWASSKKAFKHFYEHHAPTVWDYHDI